jgi:HD-GYP domain-containing protein (c-di-GMP phosphodiesterase class II)
MSLLVAVADVHAAPTELRAYKPAVDEADALAVMRCQLGSHFEPGMFAAYERAILDAAPRPAPQASAAA